MCGSRDPLSAAIAAVGSLLLPRSAKSSRQPSIHRLPAETQPRAIAGGIRAALVSRVTRAAWLHYAPPPCLAPAQRRGGAHGVRSGRRPSSPRWCARSRSRRRPSPPPSLAPSAAAPSRSIVTGATPARELTLVNRRGRVVQVEARRPPRRAAVPQRHAGHAATASAAAAARVTARSPCSRIGPRRRARRSTTSGSRPAATAT